MTINTTEALQYFKKHDPVMADLLQTALTAERPIAIPQEKSVTEYFSSIVSSIISQQISTKAADSVRGRTLDYLGEFTPKAVIKADFDTLKACGLSNQKTKYIKHNAEIWHTIPTQNFTTMTDEEIISELTKLYGIGRWTVEMFLMFSMARPDVFSYGDLGLMKSLYQHYNYKPHYTRKIQTTVDAWSPHRTTASLALWHTIDNGPVLL
jgi:3-methyladenine DNA glycosylase/8-oxoguanine DNA glycosylase